MKEGRFRFCAVLDLEGLPLEKSMSVPIPKDFPKDFLIKGNFLNQVKDASGEIPLLDEMDFSYFDKNGFIKYEHDPVTTIIEKGAKVIQTSTPDPDNIIGAPLRRSRHGSSEILEGALFPGMDKAQKVVKLMKEIKAHNANFPESKRAMNFSIEGTYKQTKSLPKGHYAGRVINVVLSPNGQDATTCARLADEANKVMAKSMAASQDSEQETNNSQSSLGSRTMKKHHSRQEAYSFALSKSTEVDKTKRAAEAKAYADAWYKELTDFRKSNRDSLDNIIKSATTAFSEVADLATKQVKELDEQATNIQSMDASLKKSIAAMEADEEVDGPKFIAQVGRSVTQTAELVRSGQVNFAKTMNSFVNGMTQLITLTKSLVEQNSDLAEANDEVIDRITRIEIGAAQAKTNITKSLTGLTPAGGDSAEPADTAEMIKSISNIRAQDYLITKAGQEENQEKRDMYARGQRTVLSKGIAALPKNLLDEVIKNCAPASN